MKDEDIIRKRVGSDSGFRVPDGFLEPVYKDVMKSLPDRRIRPAVPRTLWQRVRPYVYLAAMFAGLWCTMKIVSNMQISRQKVSLDNPPALVAQAVAAPEVEAGLNLSQQLSDVDIVGDVATQYESIEDFRQDFGYELSDPVDDIDISALRAELDASDSRTAPADDGADTDDEDDYYYFPDDIYYDYYASL